MTEIKGEVNELLPNTYLGGSRDCKVIKKKKKKCRGLFGVPILKSRSSSHPLFFGGGFSLKYVLPDVVNLGQVGLPH